jgi:hypothetical protein
MVQVTSRFPFPARFPFPVPLIGGAGKTGKETAPEIPENGKNGKNGKDSERIAALGSSLAKVSRLADAALRRLSPADRAAAFAECRGEA